jgi:hypothetical protein
MNIFFKKNILHIIFLQIFIFVFFVSSAQAILTEGVGNWGMSNPSMVSTTYEKFTDTIGATSKVNKCRSLFLVKDNTYTKIRDVFAGDADCVEGTDDCADASAFDEDKDGNPSVEANAKFCVVKKGLTKGLDINNDLNFPDELTTPTSVARGVDYNDCEHIFASKDNRWAERLSGTTCPYIGWTPVQDLSAVPEALGVKWPKDVENPDTLSMAWDEFGRRHIYVFKGNKSREYTDFNRPYFYKTDDKGLSYSICTFFETTYSSLANLNCTKIGDANYPPTLATLSNQTAMVGKFFNYNVRASDLDGDKLIWKYKIDGVDVSSSNSKDFTYCSSGSIESTCTVGDACVNTDTVPVAGTCKKWTISFGDTSQNNVKKIYTTAPPFTINKKITVTVGDDDGKGAGTVNATDTESFDLSVIKTGLAITSTPVKFVRVTSEFASYAYDVEAYDPDNYYPLTYSWNFVSPSTAFPEGLNASSINQYNGLIMGTIAGTGKNTVKVTVTNSNTPPASTTQAFTIESVDNYCGNNVTSTYGILADYYEECDDGNIDSTDKCDTYDKNGYGECKATFCGDGKIETPNGRDFSSAQPIDQTSGFNEECDDGTGTGAGRGSNDYKTQSTTGSNPIGKDAGNCIIDIDESPKGIFNQSGSTTFVGGPTKAHYWSFNENGGGLANDIVVSADNLISYKTPILPVSANWVGGKYNNGVEFVGDSYFRKQLSTTGYTATDSVTLSVWFQKTSDIISGAYGQIDPILTVTNISDGGPSYLVGINESQSIQAGWSTAIINKSTGTKLINDSLWHHLVVVVDPISAIPVVKLYVDGILISTDPIDGSLYPTIKNTVSIGGWDCPACGNTYSYLDAGKVDDARIYSTALTDDEIKDLYNGEGHGCSTARCGDGYFTPAIEQCDDFGWGWGDNTDQCTDNCTLTGCGDGVIQNPNGLKTFGKSPYQGEEDCDDFGTNAGQDPTDDEIGTTESGKCIIDLPTLGCIDARCGDNYFSAKGPDDTVGTPDDEMCDDGDVFDTNNDTCNTKGTGPVDNDGTCSLTFLGDGIKQTPNGYNTACPFGTDEGCDDGDTDPRDECNTFCAPSGNPAGNCGTDALGHSIPCTGPSAAPSITTCGDGLLNNPTPNSTATGGPANNGLEDCDGTEGIVLCSTLPQGFVSGTVSCGGPNGCTYDTSTCVSTCKFDDPLAVFNSCVFGP